MAYELVNLTLPIVIQEIENVLQDYPEHPYQAAFSRPKLRQSLIAHVLSRTPNYYEVKGLPETSNGSKVHRFSLLEEKLRMEVIIRSGILHIFRKNSSFLSHDLSSVQGDLTQKS